MASRTEELPILVESSRNIIILDVPRACSLLELIEDIHEKKFRPGCAFYEFTHEYEDIGPEKQVILMRKVSVKASSTKQEYLAAAI